MNPHAWPINNLKNNKSLCVARIFHDSSMIFCVFLLCSVDTHWNAQVHCRLIMDYPASHLNKVFPCLWAHQPNYGKDMGNMCATPKVTSFTILHEAVGGIRKHQSTHRTIIYLLHIVRALLKCVRMYAKWLRAFQLARLKVLHSLKCVAKVLGKLGSCVVLCRATDFLLFLPLPGMLRKMRWVAHGSSDMLWCVWYLVVHFSFNWIGFSWINLNTSVPCPHRFAEQLARPFLRSSGSHSTHRSWSRRPCTTTSKGIGSYGPATYCPSSRGRRPQAGGQAAISKLSPGLPLTQLKVQGVHCEGITWTMWLCKCRSS